MHINGTTHVDMDKNRGCPSQCADNGLYRAPQCVPLVIVEVISVKQLMKKNIPPKKVPKMPSVIIYYVYKKVHYFAVLCFGKSGA